MHEYFEYKEEEEYSESISEVETISSTEESTGEKKEFIEDKYVYNIFKSRSAEENPSNFWYNVNDDGSYVHILNDNGTIGSFFKGLFGYNSNPILIEVILWFAALIFGLIIWKKSYQ
jgi:hypothetical protein